MSLENSYFFISSISAEFFIPAYINNAMRFLINLISSNGKTGHVKLIKLVMLLGSGTIAGAIKKLAALPKLLKTKAIPVAVVRSLGGNQAEDTADGAENTTMPAIPFKIAQIWHILKKIGLEKYRISIKTISIYHYRFLS